MGIYVGNNMMLHCGPIQYIDRHKLLEKPFSPVRKITLTTKEEDIMNPRLEKLRLERETG